LAFAVALILFGAWIGYKLNEEKLNCRTEAVDRGFAEWVPDKEGNTTFKWKEKAK
jgi:hypothetical protein